MAMALSLTTFRTLDLRKKKCSRLKKWGQKVRKPETAPYQPQDGDKNVARKVLKTEGKKYDDS